MPHRRPHLLRQLRPEARPFACNRGGRRATAAPFVCDAQPITNEIRRVVLIQQMQQAIGDREKGPGQFQHAIALLATDAGEGPQVLQADLNPGKFHRLLGGPAFNAVPRGNWLPRFIEQGNPVGDESAFAGLVAVQFLGQRRLAAAAHAVAHDHDMADFEHLHGKFQRC